MAAAFQAALPQTAQAQFFPFFEGRPSPRAYYRLQPRFVRPPDPKVAEEARQPKYKPTNALIAVVSLSDQRISVYGGDGLIAGAPVSTGMVGHRTPTGVFSVIQKNRWHRSNIYSGAPMPYMQRITWSGVALHAGVLPGYPASHGCIRLPTGFAQQLWAMTKLGARVVVAPRHTAAFEIAHPNLPLPTMTPVESPVAEEGVAEAGTVPSDSVNAVPPSRMVALNTSSDSAEPVPIPTPKLLNPSEVAELARAKTRTAAAAAAKAAKTALKHSVHSAGEARQAVQDLKKAEASLAAAEVKLAEAKEQVDEARVLEETKRGMASAAVASLRAAEEASKVAEAAAQAALRALEPVSLFISRKKGRLYVRQRWAPVIEVPVTIHNPELPIGTHLFVAMDPEHEGGPLRWMGVSVPETDTAHAAKGKARDDGRVDGPASARHETADGALSRIEMPAEALKLIADRTWTGATLIVSDHAMSNETGAYTDFIVSTR
jgi:lipoprotein-anchoring transpeptidase ErfK/SrfK